MAGGGAGALLLRAAALSGFTAAAWLLSGHVAQASPEEPPAVEITVETPQEAPQLREDPAGWASALTAAILDNHQARRIPAPINVTPKQPEPEAPAEEDDGPALDFTGGTHSNTRSGTVSNQAPPEVVKAKAQVRAARVAAKAAAEAPAPPPPAPVTVAKKIVPQLPELPARSAPKTESNPKSDLTWTEPGQDAPLPTPQPAPVVATASASSGHTDNSGGTRGVLAVLTSHNSLFPPATWSVEERCDGRSPGSLPGLPSTSPD